MCRIRLAALHRRYAEKRVIVFEADVDERLNRSRNFLQQERAFGRDHLLLGNQIAIKHDQLRVREKRVGAALQIHVGAAFFSAAEGLVQPERNVCRFDRRLELVVFAFGRLNECRKKLANGGGIHWSLDGESADATLLEESEDIASELVFIARQPQFAAVDEERFIVGL